MKSFNISIISPSQIIYEGEGLSLVAPCANGYMGILADHAPLVAKIIPGRISVTKPDHDKLDLPSNSVGILEVLKNKVTLILHKDLDLQRDIVS